MNPDLIQIDKVVYFIGLEASKENVLSDDLFDPKIFEFLKSKYGNEPVSYDSFTVVPLPYYYELNGRLGSLDNPATTYVHSVQKLGWYSVYFCVVGKKWSKRYFSDTRGEDLRMVQERVIVT